MRRKAIKPIKESIQKFAESLEMNIDDPGKAGHNQSTQYIFHFSYDSVVLNRKEKVKIEVGLRSNPRIPVQEKKIIHKFLHPFTGYPLFEGRKIRHRPQQPNIMKKYFKKIGYCIRDERNPRHRTTAAMPPHNPWPWHSS